MTKYIIFGIVGKRIEKKKNIEYILQYYSLILSRP